jgi:hypothetical protein
MRQRGITLIGLLFWAIVIAFVGIIAAKIVPTVNEFLTIKRTVKVVAEAGGGTVPEIRSAFARQASVQYGIESITPQDLEITKENDLVVISFAYDKEVQLAGPVYLLIKYSGNSR